MVRAPVLRFLSSLSPPPPPYSSTTIEARLAKIERLKKVDGSTLINDKNITMENKLRH